MSLLRILGQTVTTEFFVNLVGNSRPQNQAIAAAIEEDMKEKHGRSARHEGTADSGWILLDYGDIIVNVRANSYTIYISCVIILPLMISFMLKVMTPRSRAYYDIESFWKGAVLLDLSDVIWPNSATHGTTQSLESLDKTNENIWHVDDEDDFNGDDSDDAFWS